MLQALKVRQSALVILIILLVPVSTSILWYFSSAQMVHFSKASDTLLMLINDDIPISDVRINYWQQAAREQGLHLKTITDTQFLQTAAAGKLQEHIAGMIIPDQMHQKVNGPLLGEIEKYVVAGGHLLIVFDANQKNIAGIYYRFRTNEALVGLHYNFYQELGAQAFGRSAIVGSEDQLKALEIPPGKYFQVDDSDLSVHTDEPMFGIAGYEYGLLSYPFFTSDGDYHGHPILQSSTGSLIAGNHLYGRGNVLFVNLPLTYLQQRTDGMFLHSFLHLFAVKQIGLPYLGSTPDAKGGVIYNFHVDDKEGIYYLSQVMKSKIGTGGPYSMHFTTGPDVDRPNSGGGMDLAHNNETKRWIHYFIKRGDEVGSHGGWIHNYFGLNANEHNAKVFLKYLDYNKRDLENNGVRQVTEYSAPNGNQPEWATEWLLHHGFTAYYDNANSGMGPTASWRSNGTLRPGLWEFPVATYRDTASLEEFRAAEFKHSDVTQWLFALTDYCREHYVVRLFYSHPVFIPEYLDVLEPWVNYVNKLKNQGHIRWYTMTHLAQFLNLRQAVHWSADTEPSRKTIFKAHSAFTLAHQNWILPADHYRKPQITKGQGQVVADNGNWIVIAGDGKQFQFTADVIDKKS